MKNIIFVLILLVSELVKSQESVYVVGMDSTSYVLFSGEGEKILNQNWLDLGIGGLTDKMVDSIKFFVNNPSINFYIPTNDDRPYTKLNTEVVFESHVIHKGFDMIINPYSQYIFDSLFVNFKNSGIQLDSDETYIVIYNLEEYYQPGVELYSSTNESLPITRHIILTIRRILR